MDSVNLAAHVVSTVFEVTLLAYWISIASYGMFLQLLFLQRCQEDLITCLQTLR